MTLILYVVSVVLVGIFVALILGWREEQQRTMLVEQEVAVVENPEAEPATENLRLVP